VKQKVTACLIVWKRQDNIPEIIKSLNRWSFINQIMILDNSKGKNIINYGRYLQAQRAENDLIYVQDDDCLVNNVDEIYDRFISDPTKICHAGINDYQKVIPENIYGKTQMAMLGWGAVFDRKWIGILDKYTDKYGKDYCFYRETDRIFTMLLNQHHNFVLGDIVSLKGERDQYALSQQKDHLYYKKLAIERCLTLI